ncbi:MAG: SusC/RagA family TonB-linked outer membrane protein [Gemmatimonadaceae bacterium]|nr:SusC/RagA family TonB-linked outer membrane protein [Gemmatimonadaceae bacterium]
MYFRFLGATLARRVVTCVASLVAMATVAPPATAQVAARVVGQISDAESKQPVAFAQVALVAGARRLAARTDENGRYQFGAVPSGTWTLEVLRVSYRRAERSGIVVPASGEVVVDVAMTPVSLNLKAIVTTGVTDPAAGTKVPFTVGRVAAEDAPVPATNAIETVAGKVAGVSVIPTGQAGSGINIQLRTPTSINKSNDPLIVVDGVILSQSFGAATADLQSMDIESIEVVKGAAAATLYGSRAASGVIQIRTRRGSAGGGGDTRYTVRSEFGANALARRVQWAQQHYYLTDAAGDWVNATGTVVPPEQRVPKPLTARFQDTPYKSGTFYDQVDRFFDPGNFVRNSFNVSQSNEKTNWFLSYVNQREDGVVLNAGRYDQNDLRFNLDHRPRSDLSFGISTYHMRSTRQNLYDDTFFDLINQAPDVDLRQRDPDGTPYIFQPDFEGREENPLYVLATERNQRLRTRTQGSLQARWAPAEWFTLEGNLSYDRSDRNTNFFLDQGKKTEGFANGGPGQISRFNGVTDALNGQVAGSLLRSFGPVTLRGTVRGLFERERNNLVTASGTNFAAPGVESLNNATIRFVSSTDEQIRTNSLVLGGAADYEGRLVLDVVGRRDGSSLFGPEQQIKWFYRGSAAWRMAQEKWWPLRSVNEFKLRVSQGTAGGRPGFFDQYETYDVLEGGGLAKATLGNRFLRPEFAKETEVGLDAIIKNRFSVQLSRARQVTTDQLVLVPLAGAFGYTSQWQNAGTVTGTTWEATVEAQMIKSAQFSWRLGLVADRTRNRITEFNRACFTTQTIAFRCANETIGSMYGFRFIRGAGELPASVGARANEFQVNDDGYLVWVGPGNTFRDGESRSLWGTTATIGTATYGWGLPIQATDAAGNAAVVKIGDGNPDFRFGVSNTVAWKSLQVFMLWDAQIGGDVYNQTNQRMYQWARSRDVDQGGRPQDLKKPIEYYVTLYAAASPTDHFVEDASFLKLRELSVKYRLPPSLAAVLGKAGAKGVYLSLLGRNLLTLTKYKGYDPEVGSVLNRLDGFVYPRYRTVTGSVEITF